MSASHSSAAPVLYPDDPECLPADSVIEGSGVTRDLEDIADYVVIGSGAAGVSAAFLLAQAGFSVTLLEEGPWVRTRDFSRDVFPATQTLFRRAGTQVTMGRTPFPLLQGSCVGGGTTINSAIAWRAPEKAIDRWSAEFGLAETVTARKLGAHYDFHEKTLNVRPVSDRAFGRQSQLLEEAAQALGIRGERARRYDGGCEASASCLTGCRTGKKLGMNVTYVPRTLALGGRIYTHARVERIESAFGRAAAVHAAFKAPGRPRLRIVARRGVLVAASAVQTPGILRRSGVRLAALGRHFQTHPGTSLTARFDQRIDMENGATQGYNSTHFVESGHFKIESLSLPPEVLSLRIPEVGPALVRQLVDYRNLVNWAVVVKAEAEGSVVNVLGSEQVRYSPNASDMERMRSALRKVSELMLLAGAREIFPSVHGMPSLRSMDDLRAWEDASLDPGAYGLMASHLFGGARMGKDPRHSVVGLDFQVHGLRGAYVVDSSVFPTNIGVNPQHTIMALARLAATRIAERPLPARA